MGSLTRAEREARIAQDDGDPDDEVELVVRTEYVGHYHESEDCEHYTAADMTKTVTRAYCWRHDRAPCKQCVLGIAIEQSAHSKSLRNAVKDGEVDHEFQWDQEVRS